MKSLDLEYKFASAHNASDLETTPGIILVNEHMIKERIWRNLVGLGYHRSSRVGVKCALTEFRYEFPQMRGYSPRADLAIKYPVGAGARSFWNLIEMKNWPIGVGPNATALIAKDTRKLIDNAGKRGKYMLIYRILPKAGGNHDLFWLLNRAEWAPYLELVNDIITFDTRDENGSEAEFQIGLYKCIGAKR